MEQERQNVTLYQKLEVIDDLTANNRQQLERLIDLYQTGDFTRDMLVDRMSRLEEKLAGLRSERADLVACLETKTITQEQFHSLQ